MYLSLGNLGSGIGGQKLLDNLELSHLHGVPVLLNLEVNPGKTELLLLEGVKDVIGNNSPHSVQLPGKLELLDKGGGHHGGGGPGDAGLAIEDDGAGGGGVLQHGHDLIKVSLDRGLLLVGGDPEGLELGHLLLDGGVDLVESGDAGQLLCDLLVVGSLLGMLAELVLEELELISPLLDLLGKGVLEGGDVLGVVHLKMKVDAKSIKGYILLS